MSKKTSLKILSFITLAAFMNMMAGCNYYTSNTILSENKSHSTQWTADKISQLQEVEKYLIIHQGDNMWHLTDPKLSTEPGSSIQVLNGYFGKVSEGYLPFIKKMENVNTARYTHKEKGYVLTQVHIYISDFSQNADSTVMIPLSSIEKIEVYNPEIGATVASYAFSILGIAAASCVALLIVLIAVVCGCPYVYQFDGANYIFTGNLYTGAIYPSLERDDYLLLDGVVPIRGEYQFKIANKKAENQFTNLFELMVVQHPANVQVIPDKNGNIHTVSGQEAPLSAISFGKYDHLSELLAKDDHPMVFNENEQNEPLNNVVLSFRKPPGAVKAKLVINAKNSLWLGFVYDRFSALFGSAYQKWSDKQAKAPAEKTLQWELDQALPLLVYLKSAKGWELIDYFNMVGTMAARDMVMPIDIPPGNYDTVQIMIKTGFMFWELDYAAIDFSPDMNLKTDRLKPFSATDANGNNYVDAISKNDTSYLKHYCSGEDVVVRFNAQPQTEATNQTVILHGRGYYTRLNEYQGRPWLMALKKFKKPGALSEYSKSKYLEGIRKLAEVEK
ncbi:MAG: hypothetical protein NTU44_00930 [Bacteroidetes bacterium]|nr:hypothetical protein [Bacteroidota bacterium]